MKQIIVAKDLNYAPLKGGTAANTAVHPSDLAEGAIGIYGISKTSANNKDKLALIVDGGSDAAGKVPDSDFDGEEVFVAVGTKEDSFVSFPVNPKTAKVTAVAHTAGAKQVSYIGFNAADNLGDVTFLNTLETDLEIGLTIMKRNYDEGGDRITENYTTTAQVEAGKVSEYDVISQLARRNNDDPDVPALATVVAEGTATAITRTGGNLDLILTKGSNKALFTADGSTGADPTSDLAEGDMIVIKTAAADNYGEVFKIVSIDTGSVVLDRSWENESATIVADDAAADELVAKIESLTAVGLKLTGRNTGEHFEIAVRGDIERSSIVTTTSALFEQGNGNYILDLEDELRGFLGSTDKINTFAKFPDLKAVSDGNYDLYHINFQGKEQPKGSINAKVFDVTNDLFVAFPTGDSDAATKGQGAFENIMGVLINGTDGLGGIDAA